jgi:hypothetical protein
MEESRGDIANAQRPVLNLRGTPPNIDTIHINEEGARLAAMICASVVCSSHVPLTEKFYFIWNMDRNVTHDHEPLARRTAALRLNFKGRCGRRTGVHQDIGSTDRRPPGIGGP